MGSRGFWIRFSGSKKFSHLCRHLFLRGYRKIDFFVVVANQSLTLAIFLKSPVGLDFGDWNGWEGGHEL